MQTSYGNVNKDEYAEARAEAKKLQKEGWMPTEGMPSIEDMLINVKTKRNTRIETSKSRYLFSTSTATSSNMEEAKMIAEDDAKTGISAQLKDSVFQVVKRKDETINYGHDSIEAHQNLTIYNTSDTRMLIKNSEIDLSIYKYEDNKVKLQIIMSLDKVGLNGSIQ